MKILFIAADTNALGGIQQYNRRFLAVLESRGDEVNLVELKKGNLLAKIYFVLNSLFKSLFFKPDITICAHINYSPIGLVAKRLFGRKYIVCTHGVDAWNIKKSLKREAVQKADLITTVSEYTRDKIVEQIPRVKERVYFLYNSVDENMFVPKEKPSYLMKRYNLKGEKVVFTVARLLSIEGYKGYDRVIQAMPKILEKVPNTAYLLAGKGDDSPRIEKLVEEMGLENKVIMAGYVPNEEIVDHYNLADVFVMPSKAEGAPAVYVEALACGIPVVAGDKDGSATPLRNGELGLLVDPEDVDEIASAIVDILNSNVEEKLLDGKFLREKVVEKFGSNLFPKRVNEALEMTLKSSN